MLAGKKLKKAIKLLNKGFTVYEVSQKLNMELGDLRLAIALF